MEKNLKFAWVSDFLSVKCWVAKYLKLDGVRDSLGGEKKAFYFGDIPTIYWWNRKKLLSFNGPNAVAIKQKLLSTLCDGDIPPTNSPNIHAKTKSSCSCNVLSADLGGIKLDMTISQYKQGRDIGCNSIAIDQVEKVLGKMQKEFENINITMHALANKVKSELNVNNMETISCLRNENTLLCVTLEVLTLELANQRMSSEDPTAYFNHQSKPDDSAVETVIVYNANSQPASRTKTISPTHTTTEESYSWLNYIRL